LFLGSVLAQVPHGSYCGDNSDISLRVGITIIDAGSVKIVANVAGDTIGCVKEDYKYDVNTKIFSFPNIKSASDCLGGLLNQYEVDPDSLKVTYDTAKNSLDINAEGFDIILTDCTFKKIGKTGTYCGHSDSLMAKATVIMENSTIAIAVKYKGKIYSCPNEKYSILEDNKVVFPGAFINSDCLGDIIASNNVDPNSISVVYDPKDDSATVTGPEGTTFTLRSCEREMEEIHPSHKIKAPIPEGAYCGSYDDILTNAVVKVLSLTQCSLHAEVFGSDVTCNQENVQYIAQNGTVRFPTITSSSDCLGNTLSGYGVDPSGLQAKWDNTTNSIIVNILDITITFKSCTPPPSAFEYVDMTYHHSTRKFQHSTKKFQ